MERWRVLDRAIRFSEFAHRGQNRKGTENPYFGHPAAVAMLVLAHGYAVDAAIVALLHDVLEDTPTTREDIEAAFGEEITGAIVDLSEADKSLPWEARKSAYVAHLAHARDLALPACAADKIHNLRSTLWDLDDARAEGNDPSVVWSRFKRPPRKICAYHRAVWRALTARGFGGSLLGELDGTILTFARAVGVDADDDRFDG